MPPKSSSSIRGEYIETETGNKISRRASILGPKHIILAGKCVIQQDCVLHGDLVRPPSATAAKPSSQTQAPATQTEAKNPSATKPPQPSTPDNATSIHLGRYVFLSPNVILHPPSRLSSTPSSQTPSQSTPSSVVYYPLRLSDHIFIGPHTTVRAASISSHTWIGSHCNIGNMVIIKENCRILDYTVLPANSVWSAGSIVAGRPGRVVGEVGEGWSDGGSGGGGGGGGKDGGGEGVGVRSTERWASVGNHARGGKP